MKPIIRKSTNSIFKRPDCFDLPGSKYMYNDGTPAIETCWELDDIELEKIKKTRKIYIQQEGNTLAPMAVSVNSVLADGEENQAKSVKIKLFEKIRHRKSADKLFKELGYRKLKNINKDVIKYQGEEDIYILFDSSIQCYESNSYIDMKGLEAINKKVGELGWK